MVKNFLQNLQKPSFTVSGLDVCCSISFSDSGAATREKISALIRKATVLASIAKIAEGFRMPADSSCLSIAPLAAVDAKTPQNEDRVENVVSFCLVVADMAIATNGKL